MDLKPNTNTRSIIFTKINHANMHNPALIPNAGVANITFVTGSNSYHCSHSQNINKG